MYRCFLYDSNDSVTIVMTVCFAKETLDYLSICFLSDERLISNENNVTITA